MTNDNIFSGLKVVDFASFIAGPAAAVILSDFGADVIKVEPPSGDMWRIGHKLPPQPQSEDAYPFHMANRNKRGIALDLKSPGAQPVLERLVKWADVFIVNTPHPARKRLKLEYDDVVEAIAAGARKRGATWSGVAHRQPVKPIRLASRAALAVVSPGATPPREPGRHSAPSGCLASIRAATSVRAIRKR